MKPELKYLREINIKSLKDFILDNKLSDTDTIVLNAWDFDNIVFEFNSTYKEPFFAPYNIIGVLIKEGTYDTTVPKGRIGILYNDKESIRKIEPLILSELSYYNIYRCGWCGNVVEQDGSLLSASERNNQISHLQKFGQSIVRQVHGKCCPQGHETKERVLYV